MRIKHISEPEPDRSEEKYEEIGDIYPYSRKIAWDALTKEVKLQQKIITCALDKQLMPPCPSILFYGAITAEEFETFKPGQLVYKEYVDPIHSIALKAYRMGIILMEYVQSDDLTNVPHDRYEAKVYEIESKALRAYCTALQCGVLQRDPKPQNFLLTEDDNVVLIDFGVAKPLTPDEVVEFKGLLQKAEAGNCDELRLALTKLETPGNLEKLIFRPRWVGPGTITKSGITKYPTLAPAIKLTEKVALEYKAGLSDPTSILPDRERLSPETIAELKRYAAHKLRRDMELDDRVKNAEAEKRELELYYDELKNPKRQRVGGKRRTKYVGNRKRVGTRRKVQNRSF